MAFLGDATGAAKTATYTSTAFDAQDYEGNLGIVQASGVVSGTTPTLDGKIQDSADGSTGWADVSGATFTQVTASTNFQKITVDLNGTKRYLRYVGTIGGTTPSFGLTVIAGGVKKY